MESRNPDNIDYMHPEGKFEHKPVKSKIAERFDGRELEAAAKRAKSALSDADGHHICSEECRKQANSQEEEI